MVEVNRPSSAENCFNGVMKAIKTIVCPETACTTEGSEKAKWAANARIIGGLALVTFGFVVQIVGAVVDATVVGVPAGVILAGIGAGIFIAGGIVLAPAPLSVWHAKLLR